MILTLTVLPLVMTEIICFLEVKIQPLEFGMDLKKQVSQFLNLRMISQVM